MLDRFGPSVRYGLAAVAGGAALTVVGLAGEAVVTALPVPGVLAVPFRLVGQLGAAVLVAVAVTVVVKVALELG